MNLLFIAVYATWLLSEILLNRLMRSGNQDKKNADRNSLWLIWLAIALSVSFATYFSMNYAYPLASGITVNYTGLLLIVTGVLLRLIIIRSLGKFFTVDVTIRTGHKLKKDGFYKYMRHPSYTASLLSFTGFGLSLNNWVALAVLTISILIVFINRIKIEERVLTEQFGTEYLDYKKSTKAIIPFVY